MNKDNGRRLRVRTAGDKDKKEEHGNDKAGQSQPKRARKEQKVEHLTRHLAYAIVGFLNRQRETLTRDCEEAVVEEKKAEFTQAVGLINSLFELPAEQTEEDPLKISRHLEEIFMQNNRREIKPPAEVVELEEEKEVDSYKATKLFGQPASEEDVDELRRQLSAANDELADYKRLISAIKAELLFLDSTLLT